PPLLRGLLASPLGPLLVEFDSGGRLHGLAFGSAPNGAPAVATAPAPVVRAVAAYFAGDMRAFDSIELDPPGTPFQREVWAALRGIPAGTTTTYGRLAAALGRPGSSRAVGLANGANPVAIVVPCHRVIGASGSLTGYGGGIERKRWLLDHERRATEVTE
ncbi:MAG TPA: methylated-DNA--[protein]-cysteine S-methyltransferase, partial [Candidatus Limnocylindrales bacterium]|nr:methylated-DNA--[protein]-cysteine S-methyltransferase [Candidatus Limnocylindrales bacterium]